MLLESGGLKKIISLLKDHGKEKLLSEEYIRDCVCDVCYKMFKNDGILDFLAGLQTDEEFQKKVAYGRLYYLNETKMLEELNLYEGDSIIHEH
jgi:hypothetical protein